MSVLILASYKIKLYHLSEENHIGIIWKPHSLRKDEPDRAIIVPWGRDNGFIYENKDNSRRGLGGYNTKLIALQDYARGGCIDRLFRFPSEEDLINWMMYEEDIIE